MAAYMSKGGGRERVQHLQMRDGLCCFTKCKVRNTRPPLFLPALGLGSPSISFLFVHMLYCSIQVEETAVLSIPSFPHAPTSLQAQELLQRYPGVLRTSDGLPNRDDAVDL